MSVAEASTASLENLQKKGDDYQSLIAGERKRLQELSSALSAVDTNIEFYRNKAKESAIEVMNKHILTPKPAFQKADGAEIGKQAEIVERKTMEMLEMKLNKIKQRNNEINNGNLLLAQEVNHMRKWKMQTELAHKNAEGELARLKEQIKNVMDHCNGLRSKRDEIIERRGELIRQNREEGEKFEAEYENLGKYIVTQNKQLETSLLQERKNCMKDMVAIRNMNLGKSGKRKKSAKAMLSNTSRNALETMDSAIGFTGHADNVFLTSSHEAVTARPILQPIIHHDTRKSKRKQLTEEQLNQDTVILDRIRQLDALIVSYQENVNTVSSKIFSYSEVLNQIRRSIGIHDIDDSLQTYGKQEEEMFSLYSYIQSLSSELEWIEEQKGVVKDEMTKYRTSQESMEEERRVIISSLHDKINSLVDVKHALKASLELSQSSVESIGKKVHAMFFKLQCDQMTNDKSSSTSSNGGKRRARSSSSETLNKVTLLSSQGISESNVLDYLSVLEERSMEIVTNFLKKTSHDDDADYDDDDEDRFNPLLGPKTPANSSSLSCCYPPSLHEVDEWTNSNVNINADEVDQGGAADDGSGEGNGSLVNIKQFKESLKSRVTEFTFLTET